MPSIRQAFPGQICVHSAVQNSKHNGICLPPPINQSTPVLVSSIWPQSSSDFDTDHGEFIDETIKQLAQSVNQMLLMNTTGNPTSNLTPSNSSQDKTLDRQSMPTLILSDNHTQTKIQLTHTYRQVSSENSIAHPVQISNRLNKS